MGPQFVNTQPTVQTLGVRQNTDDIYAIPIGFLHTWEMKTLGVLFWAQWQLNKKSGKAIIAKRTRSAGKVLFAIFFNSSGPIVQIPCKDGKTITDKFYKNKVLATVKNSIKINDQVKVWKAYSLFMTMRPPTKVKLYSNSFNKNRLFSLSTLLILLT